MEIWLLQKVLKSIGTSVLANIHRHTDDIVIYPLIEFIVLPFAGTIRGAIVRCSIFSSLA